MFKSYIVALFIRSTNNVILKLLAICCIYLCFCGCFGQEAFGQSLSTGSSFSYHSLAVTADGKTYAWGANWNGQLGNGTYTNSATAQDISGYGALIGKKIVSISNGYSHTLALASVSTFVDLSSNVAGVPAQTGKAVKEGAGCVQELPKFNPVTCTGVALLV